MPVTAPLGTATFCIGASTSLQATPIQTITMAVQNLDTPAPPAAIDAVDVRDHQVTVRWLPPSSGPEPVGYLLEGGRPRTAWSRA